MKNLDWKVIYYDINGRKIDTYNVFKHSSFASEVDMELNMCETKEEFAEKLRKSLQYLLGRKRAVASMMLWRAIPQKSKS